MTKKWLFKKTYIYLQVLGNNNKLNTGAKVRLQLFEPPSSNVRSTPNQPEVGHLIFQCYIVLGYT
jgi:hypothetical protein